MLVDEYHVLNRRYGKFLTEYKSLRHYFGGQWSFPTLTHGHISRFSFPPAPLCVKLAQMLLQVINANSRPGDLVAYFIMGWGR